MKPSFYTHIFFARGYSYWYNALTTGFFRVGENLGRKIESLLATKMDSLKQYLPQTVISQLQDKGFIVPNDMDEFKVLRDKHKIAKEDKNYFLVVLPTMDCNYKCWYCIQRHESSKMSPETIEKVKLHIDHMIKRHGITGLHLEWFGGEPFMYFKEVIVPISEYAMSACECVGIPFMNSATTNGFYLNNYVVKECKRLQFKQFQITLDGNQEFHDKVKFTDDCVSTFTHVLHNILNIVETIRDVNMCVRINYTHSNISEDIVNQINEVIVPNMRNHISIFPKKVWQEKVQKGFDKVLDRILENLEKSGYRVSYWQPIKDFLPCYVNRKYYNAINFNGNLVKCTACDDLERDCKKGSLDDCGKIEWIEDMETIFTQETFMNGVCEKCKRLPACMGPCPRNAQSTFVCKEKLGDASFESSVIAYIDREYSKL